jgi:hypothetical protein
MGKKMIYSPDHNFLLLKNQKVGGTSLEVSLSMVLPNNAIVTPRTTSHPSWKIEEKNYIGYNPRNYEGFYNHISYSEIQNKIDLSNVTSYVFVRNPYSSVLSHFFHRLHIFNKGNETWSEITDKDKEILVDQYFNNELGWEWHRSNRHIYTSKDGNIQADRVLRYEDGVQKEINSVLPDHQIPQININIYEKSFRPKDLSVDQVFKDRHMEKIRLDWAWEFGNLGYDPKY